MEGTRIDLTKILMDTRPKVTIHLVNDSEQQDTAELFNKRRGMSLCKNDSNIPSGIKASITTEDETGNKYEQSYDEFVCNLLEHGDILISNFQSSLPDSVVIFQRDLIKKRIFWDKTTSPFPIFDKTVIQVRLEAKEKMEISFTIDAEEFKGKQFVSP